MFRRKTDNNHKQIMAAFRSLGCSVHDTSRLGGGFPDLVVGINGVNILVEVKDGSLPPSGRKLTEKEDEFFRKWKGKAVIVSSINDVMPIVADLRRKTEKDDRVKFLLENLIDLANEDLAYEKQFDKYDRHKLRTEELERLIKMAEECL